MALSVQQMRHRRQGILSLVGQSIRMGNDVGLPVGTRLDEWNGVAGSVYNLTWAVSLSASTHALSLAPSPSPAPFATHSSKVN